jgi:hypothetical protein
MPHDVAVFGLYPDRPSLEAAVDRLRLAGFRPEDISVVFPDKQTHQLAHEINTKAPEGASTGAAAGAAAGGVLGWLIGVGALAIPGLGPFIAAGPLVAALAGAGAVGATGGLIGALVGAGMPEIEAKRYEGRLRSGGMLCSVHCDDRAWAARAKEIMTDTAAEDISSTREPVGDYHP